MKRITIVCALVVAGCSAEPGDTATTEYDVAATDDGGTIDSGEPMPPPEPTAESPIQHVDASTD
jgi:hypothetical protein